MKIITLIFCSLFLSACSAADPAQQENTQAAAWSTDVIGINEMHLSANYWIEQTENAGQVLKNQMEITEFNDRIFATDQHMVDLALIPDQLSGREVRESIQAISKPNNSDLYSTSGTILDTEGYSKYTANLGLKNIAGTIQVQFALVVNRSDMRAYPTDDRYYKTPDKQNLDRFQENGLFPGDALTVLHVSADGEWSFVQSYNYAAWVRTENIAIGDRQAIQKYKNPEHFLIVTGAKIRTSFNPEVPALSELQLDMGIRIPLADRDIGNNNLYGQNPYTSHVVSLPVRNMEGKLEFKKALIARNKDVHKGYIPYTRENITRQALRDMDIGDLIYVPGHVLMYIGDVDGQPYVIHDVSIFRYTDDNGEYYEGVLNSVAVTPLIPLYGSRESTYVDLMYNIKQVR